MKENGFYPRAILSNPTFKIPPSELENTMHEFIFPTAMDAKDVMAILDLANNKAELEVFADASLLQPAQPGEEKTATNAIFFGPKSKHNNR
jgi:hypothetical protein